MRMSLAGLQCLYATTLLQVQKRETERQLQARINSYAYISQKEEEEAWKELKVRLVMVPYAAQIVPSFAVVDVDVNVNAGESVEHC